MKGKFLVILVISLSLFLISGCEDIAYGIIDGTFGWMPGYESSSSSSSSGSQSTGNVVKNNDKNDNSGAYDIGGIKNLPQVADPNSMCKDKPNSFFSARYGYCICDDGYYEQDGRCVSESSRECIFDQDCSPGGSTKSKCVDSYRKAVYRCDLRTYQCVPRKGSAAEIVDCRTEYGQNYVCSDGWCVSS